MSNQITGSPKSHISNYNPYDLLRIYTYYRALLGSVLLLMFQFEFSPKILGSEDPQLFFFTSSLYTAINFLSLVVMWRLRFNPSQRMLFSSLLVDVAATTLLMHASGGPLGGLGYLLLIAVAAGGIMLRERIATFLAALSTLSLLGEGSWSYVTGPVETKSLFAAATLGALTFLTSLLFQYLSRKIRLTQAEAIVQATQAAHLQRLAQLIIERMRTGILVLDKEQNIELINRAASALLGLEPDSDAPSHLADIPELLENFQRWQTGDSHKTQVRSLQGNASTKANFAHLDPNLPNETLIFVEDTRALQQQAQQLKLASLGRLTASIAHEVRNPLGAISHASQLLAESASLAPADQRLLDIINNHSKRVNQIIENILQLSRRRPATPQTLNLTHWLPTFIRDYRATKAPANSAEIELRTLVPDQHQGAAPSGDTRLPPNGDIITQFDPSQLQQVLTNLCDNGLRYGIPRPGRPDLRIEIGIDPVHHLPFIQVVDYGPGIDREQSKHLFEPFYTTENTGTGLGLYICKELCEANQAYISYGRTELGESCFHLQLAHPGRAL